MSHSYETRIFTAPADGFPAAPLTADQLDQICHTAGQEASARKDALHNVFGSTRSGYAIYTLAEILKAKPFPALEFLTDTGHDYSFPGEHGEESLVTVLDRARQEEVIAAFQQLFGDLTAAPEIVYEAENFGHLCDGDVEAALARDYVSASPSLDSAIYGDEGEGADYMFAYLRSVLKVIQNAHAEGKVAVYQLEY